MFWKIVVTVFLWAYVNMLGWGRLEKRLLASGARPKVIGTKRIYEVAGVRFEFDGRNE